MDAIWILYFVRKRARLLHGEHSKSFVLSDVSDSPMETINGLLQMTFLLLEPLPTLHELMFYMPVGKESLKDTRSQNS